MRIPTSLRKFFRLPLRRRALVLEAALWLGLAKLALWVFPFARIARFQGRLQAPRTSPQALLDAGTSGRRGRLGS